MARVAFIVGEQFEDSEFRVPYDRVKAAGHEAVVVGVKAGEEISGKKGFESARIEKSIDDVRAEDFDALVIPGGYSPDHLRTNEKMVALVKAMVTANKPVAAICHAGSMLVEADVVEDRVVTSWPSVKTDLANAGARWIDREVIEDGNLITSRKPDDLPKFCDALLGQLNNGPSPRMHGPVGEA